ncbi:MAG TPA: hypothetical protein VF808_16270 [Ktedonobacterales bacterium]
MSLSTTILLVAGILSLPAGLFVAFLISQPRVRFLGLLGGLVGAAVTALALLYFVTQTKTTIEAVSWFLGAFLACSMGVAVGALLVGFFFGSGRPESAADY